MAIADKTIDNAEYPSAAPASPKPPLTRKQIFILTLLTCAGIAATILLFAGITRSENARQLADFETAAQERSVVFRDYIAECTHSLDWMVGFFNGSEKVERSEFRDFVSAHLRAHPGAFTLGWIPRVSDSDRPAYEAEAQADGLTDFQFTEKQDSDTLAPAQHRNEYYPMYFMEPYADNETATGFDTASDPDQFEALASARDYNKAFLTEPLTLPQAAGKRCAAIMAKPVYRNHAPTDSIEDRRANLQGFVIAVLCAESILDDVNKRCSPAGMDVFLYDDSNIHDKHLLCAHSSRTRTGDNMLSPEIYSGQQPPELTGMHSETTINVADKQWRILCLPTPARLAKAKSPLPAITMTVGLSAAAMIVALTLAVCRRINDRKEMLDALSTSKERYETLFQSSRDAIMTLTPEEGFLSGNPATVELFAAENLEEFISKSPADLSPEHQPDGTHSPVKAQQMMSIAMTEGSNFFEWTHKRIDDTEFFATVLLTQMQMQGQPILQATVRDITEQKKAENLIIQHKTMFETVFHSAPFGMMLLDKKLIVKKANDVAAKLVGRDASQIINKRPGDGLSCVHAAETPEGCGHSPFCPQCVIQTAVESVFTTGKPVIRTQLQHSFLVDGKEVTPWLEVCIEPLTIDNEDYVIVVIGNITEQKQAYEAKGQFLANMSHEIRTPMNAVMGFCDILAEEDLTDQQIGYVNTIATSGRHLLRVIDDILDFSKIEAGKLEIDPIDCSLSEILVAIESIVAFSAKEKGLEFKINATRDLPPRVHTDNDRLTQCLINLVNNAVKFTDHGHVHMNVSLEHRDNQPFIRFTVEDTGIGIPKDKHEKIFASFTQADGSTSRKYGGTGLGLAITMQLATLLGGDLKLTSTQGQGSVFTLTIPAGIDTTPQIHLDTFALAEPTARKPEARTFTGHILVAEDTVTNQILIRALLERANLDVTIAEDGGKAVEIASSQTFDLIFMDMQMPVMTGYEAAGILRNQGLKTPIIALTANAMTGDRDKCIDAGCDDYMGKPIDSTKLMNILTKYLTPEPQIEQQQVTAVAQI